MARSAERSAAGPPARRPAGRGGAEPAERLLPTGGGERGGAGETPAAGGGGGRQTARAARCALRLRLSSGSACSALRAIHTTLQTPTVQIEGFLEMSMEPDK